MGESPVGERIATLEAENRIASQDRRDLWEAVNGLRAMPAILEAQSEKLDRIRELCEDKRRRLDTSDARVTKLETSAAVSERERNIIIGLVAFVGSIVGGVVTWAVTHFLGAIKT